MFQLSVHPSFKDSHLPIHVLAKREKTDAVTILGQVYDNAP